METKANLKCARCEYLAIDPHSCEKCGILLCEQCYLVFVKGTVCPNCWEGKNYHFNRFA
jgi:hypothetical protein